MHARCLQKPEENIESSWTWDTDDFELPCHCWKLNPRPLEELPVFFLSHQHKKKKKGSSMTFCCCLVSMDPLHMIDLLNLPLFQRPICSLSKVTIQYVVTVYVFIFVLGHSSSEKPWIPVRHLLSHLSSHLLI